MKFLMLIGPLLMLSACSRYEEVYYISADSHRTERIRLDSVAREYAADVVDQAKQQLALAHVLAACETRRSIDNTSAEPAHSPLSSAPAPRLQDARPSTPGDRRIDINTATRRQLERLPRVGPSTAAAIMEARPFHSVEDIMRVRGIGPSTFAQIKDQIRVDGSTNL